MTDTDSPAWKQMLEYSQKQWPLTPEERSQNVALNKAIREQRPEEALKLAAVLAPNVVAAAASDEPLSGILGHNALSHCFEAQKKVCAEQGDEKAAPYDALALALLNSIAQSPAVLQKAYVQRHMWPALDAAGSEVAIRLLQLTNHASLEVNSHWVIEANSGPEDHGRLDAFKAYVAEHNIGTKKNSLAARMLQDGSGELGDSYRAKVEARRAEQDAKKAER